ncbi:MAG: hypothetical protein A2170_07055 [Deltaproteobacteria bacterium RBG_13_53_10]|nr:MAG: hypothetical protein A2170_07055 [Deltaproteobacteria bacterium RBG_13_53_10]
MGKPRKKFLYQNGVRFEITPYGLFYSPQKKGQRKKHPCPDCTFCLWCSESRCSLCLSQRGRTEPPSHSSPCKNK